MPYRKKYRIIAGVDEAGRGPIAGPLVVASLILSPVSAINGINDSKKISALQRERLFDIIISEALDFSIIEIPQSKIDEINILQATLSGMKEALESLSPQPRLCLVDGNALPRCNQFQLLACVKGDSMYASIAAASVLAKVHRDRLMKQIDTLWPQYGFAQNKGYPTRKHLQALFHYGPCPAHRLSYQPVSIAAKRFTGNI